MRKKNINAICGFIIMYISASGQYINQGITDGIFIYGLIDTLIASLIMMIVPATLFFKNKKVLAYENGKKICRNNSIIIFIISILLNSTINIGIIGGLGAIIYYYINMSLFVENNPKKQ